MMTRSRFGAWLLAALCLGTLPVTAAEIQVDNAWISDPPPGVGVSAGYFELQNDSGQELALVGVSCPRFARVEIHHSQILNGLATMQGVRQVTIPAGKQVSFIPGGYHLMLFNPSPPLDHNEVIPLDLHFDNGKTLTVRARVLRPGEAVDPLDR